MPTFSTANGLAGFDLVFRAAVYLPSMADANILNVTDLHRYIPDLVSVEDCKRHCYRNHPY